jgi:hypothetical protein
LPGLFEQLRLAAKISGPQARKRRIYIDEAILGRLHQDAKRADVRRRSWPTQQASGFKLP